MNTEHVNTNHSSEGKTKTADMEDIQDSGDEIKDHESELSATSDIEMMNIDDDDDDEGCDVDNADFKDLAAAR